MKKSFLNLRKMGFILVAASGMLAFSCGGAEETTTEEDVTEAVEGLMDELNESMDELSEGVDEAVSDMEEGVDSLADEMEEGMSCDGGDENHSCGDGSCDHGE